MSVVSGINVQQAQTYSYFVGTPTYGSEPVPAMHLRVAVNDAAVKEAHGYDGFERPFAMIPREVNGQLTWERHALEFSGHGRAGYFGQLQTDEYQLPRGVRIDPKTVKALGIAIGLETNTGTVWAQRPGENHAVVDWK